MRMTLASGAIHAPVEIGDNVIIQIPDVDRAKADLRNIVGVVLQQDDQGFHKVRTEYEMLDKLYYRSEFDKCKEKFLHVDLRTVAKEAAIGKDQGFMRCVYRKGCMSKRYLYKKNLCNSKYQNSLSCNNK